MHAKSFKKTVTVQPSGQISIGKRNAGKQIEIVEVGPGQWTMLEVVSIPAHHTTFFTESARTDMDEANEWIRKTPKAEIEKDADLDEFFEEIEGQAKKSPRTSSKKRAQVR